MKRPVPPSNFRSTGDAAEDLRRLRQATQELLDWIDTKHAIITETSGPTDLTVGAVADGQYLKRVGATLVGSTVAAGVTSFNTRTGAVVPASGDYTASQVGLGNVTNDAQLKRSTADWTGFTAQTGIPAAGDEFLIERAADGAKRTLSYAEAVSSRRFGSPYVALPTSPDAWNLEARLMTDPDLSNNGWTVTLLDSPWTTQTRAGDVDFTTNPSANTYRSTLLNGLLCVQLPSGVAVTVNKAITAANFTYKGRFWHTDFPSNGSYLGLGTTNHRLTTGVVTYYIGLEGANAIEYFSTGPSTFNAQFVPSAMGDNGLDAVRYIHIDYAGGHQQCLQLDAINGRRLIAPAQRNVAFSPTVCVMWWVGGNPLWFDFVRRTPYLTLP